MDKPERIRVATYYILWKFIIFESKVKDALDKHWTGKSIVLHTKFSFGATFLWFKPCPKFSSFLEFLSFFYESSINLIMQHSKCVSAKMTTWKCSAQKRLEDTDRSFAYISKLYFASPKQPALGSVTLHRRRDGREEGGRLTCFH